MDLRKLHNSLKDKLSQILEVWEWDTTQFSILPEDNSKGYLQISEMRPGPVYKTTWMVGIAVASTDWDDLWDQVYNKLEKINSQLVHPPPCIEPGGNLKLESSIEVEVPGSYSNSTGISNSDGWKTAITFALSLSG